MVKACQRAHLIDIGKNPKQIKSENTHYAIYDNVEGLQIGTKVTISGLAVGKVAQIDFLPNSAKILVTFTLRKDVSFSKNSLGKFMILDHIEIAKEIGLNHLYLGYLIEDSPKMKYKAHFSPLEYFANGKWQIYGETSKNENENLSELVTSLNPILLPESYNDLD